jgi:uncharacterized Zn finger protein
MSFWGYAPYVSVAERRKKAEKAAAKAKKAGANFSPVEPSRGAIAKTVWGKAWCDNLEQYSDYESRLPRGRTYVRNGSVIDLKLAAGEVQAQVMGSSLYSVKVSVQAVPAKQWKAICTDCAASIDSLVELLQGKLAQPVMARICTPKTGLFPAPKDIQFSCSCPDWASMCKHVAAVLYGVGNRLDQQPELLFSLRQVDAMDLVAQAGSGLPKAIRGPAASKVLDDSALGDVFGLEMDELEAMPTAKPSPSKASKTQKVAKAPVKTMPVKAALAKSSTATGKVASKASALGKAKLPKPTAKPVKRRAEPVKAVKTVKAVTLKTSKAPAKTPSLKTVPAKSSAGKAKPTIATKKPTQKPKTVAR